MHPDEINLGRPVQLVETADQPILSELTGLRLNYNPIFIYGHRNNRFIYYTASTLPSASSSASASTSQFVIQQCVGGSSLFSAIININIIILVFPLGMNIEIERVD